MHTHDLLESTCQSTILLVDDDNQIRRALRNALEQRDVTLLEAGSGAAAVDLAATAAPDVMILDLGLPDIDGLEVCRQIRQWSSCVVIVLSARHSEREKVALLNAGADDYVTKPFSVAEMRARVRAHLRRRQQAKEPSGSSRVVIDSLCIDLASRRVDRGGITIHLTPIEWQLLATLVAARGRTMTHRQIFDLVWRRQHGNAGHYLRVHVSNLRRKIERDAAAPRILITEPGVGYYVEMSG